MRGDGQRGGEKDKGERVRKEVGKTVKSDEGQRGENKRGKKYRKGEKN
jgi:hypothetical protein